MWSREELAAADSDDLAELAELALRTLAERGEPAAFSHLLRMTAVAGECVGVAARSMAAASSWAGVGELAGTTRQAAWERWRAP
jgi:hypothetical protein